MISKQDWRARVLRSPVLRGVLRLLMLSAVEVKADSYMAALDQAQWDVQRSPLVCRLTQVVPHFGEAIFETAGGGRQRFILRANKNLLVGGPADFTAEAPSWNPSRESVALGTVEIAGTAEPLQLDDELAGQVLDSLHRGLVPVFARPQQDDNEKIARIALSPINFRPAYRDYHACIAQLFPVTFEDVKNTVIEFTATQSELSAAAQKKIDFLLRYIALDHSVTHFELHAVSGDNKRALDNLTLAKQRAEQVSEYLMSRGIDAKAIESSYRIQRVRENENPQRFVSIRLMRSSAPN